MDQIKLNLAMYDVRAECDIFGHIQSFETQGIPRLFLVCGEDGWRQTV
jgi:hypothetical protein